VESAPGVTRRVVRLFVLLGVVVAAYLLLSLFDHAARADVGSTDHIGASDPLSSVKITAADAKKAIPQPKSIAPKTPPRRSQRPTIKMPETHSLKAQPSKKVHASKIRPPIIQAVDAARRAPVRTSRLRPPTPAVVRDVARATGTHVRTAVVRPKLSTPVQLPSLAELTKLPDLPQPLSRPQSLSWARLPAWSWRPSLPQTQIPAWPQLPGLPQGQLSAWSHLAGPSPVPMPVLTRTTALPNPLVPDQPLMSPVCPLPQSPGFTSVPRLSGVTSPPAAQAQPQTAPLPAPPRQPADRSTPAGQARDSGGSSAPAMGTVSSSWRPEVKKISK